MAGRPTGVGRMKGVEAARTDLPGRAQVEHYTLMPMQYVRAEAKQAELAQR